MKKKLWRTIAPLALVALAGAGLAGCSGSDSGGSGDKVTITVGNEPTSDQTAALKVYKKQVADFEKANPNIKVNPTTTKYDAQTFQALVASGKMPDVISVPFTDIQSLIARGQVADITSEIKADPQASKVNPTVAKVAQAGGKTYGAAIGAYTIPSTGDPVSLLWANLGTLLGAACFLVAAVLSRRPIRPPLRREHRPRAAT